MSRHATAEDLSAYVDQELEPVRLRLVEDHLEDCDECRDRLDGMQRLVGDLRRLKRLTPPSVLGSHLHRRIALQTRPQNLLDRVESRLGRVSLQPSVISTFALVFAFAAILYLFAGSLDLQERLRIPVLRPYPPPVSQEALEQIGGRSFLQEGGLLREEGLPKGAPVTKIPSTDPRALEVLQESPDLVYLLDAGFAVELEHLDEILRILPSEAAP